MKTFVILMLAMFLGTPAMAQTIGNPGARAAPPGKEPVGLSINLITSIDAVDKQGNRAPTGHNLEFTSAPGNVEQVMIQWYGYIERLTNGCGDGETLENLGARVIEAQ